MYIYTEYTVVLSRMRKALVKLRVLRWRVKIRFFGGKPLSWVDIVHISSFVGLSIYTQKKIWHVELNVHVIYIYIVCVCIIYIYIYTYYQYIYILNDINYVFLYINIYILLVIWIYMTPPSFAGPSRYPLVEFFRPLVSASQQLRVHRCLL